MTGETKRVSVPSPASKPKSSFPSPWSNDPLREADNDGFAERDDQDDQDDFEGPEDAERTDYTNQQGRRRAQATSSSSRTAVTPELDLRKRDSVTGAIIDDAPPLHRSPSGRSLSDRYAERYSLGAAGRSKGGSSVSLSLKSKRSRTNGGMTSRDSLHAGSNGNSAPGWEEGGPAAPTKKKGLSGLFGGGGKKKHVPEIVQDSSDFNNANPYSNGPGLPPGGAFGADDDLDRELQGVRAVSSSGGGRINGSNGSTAPAGYKSKNPYMANGDSVGSTFNDSATADPLNHRF